MTNFNEKSLLDRIQASLNVPKNYRSRLRAQFKRYEGTKSPDELRDHILTDWKSHALELENFWNIARSIHNVFFEDLVEKRISLEMEIEERQRVSNALFRKNQEGCRALANDRKISYIKEYIALGINADQAARMVADSDHCYDIEAIEQHITQEYLKWQNQDY